MKKKEQRMIVYEVQLGDHAGDCSNCPKHGRDKVLCVSTFDGEIRLCHDCAKALRECITHNLKELK